MLEKVFISTRTNEQQEFLARGLTVDADQDISTPDPVGDFLKTIRFNPITKSNGDAAWNERLAEMVPAPKSVPVVKVSEWDEPLHKSGPVLHPGAVRYEDSVGEHGFVRSEFDAAGVCVKSTYFKNE